MRSTSANSGKPAGLFPPIHSPNNKPPPRSLPRKNIATSSDKLPQLVPAKSVITRRETLPESIDGRSNSNSLTRSHSSSEYSENVGSAKRCAPVDPFSTPARRRRLIADISRFLLKQYYIKACDNVARWRLLSKCATRIQSIVRMYLAVKTKRALRLERRNRMCHRIQQLYRQHAARRELQRRVMQRELQIKAALALRLQCYQRRLAAKSQLETLRQQHQRRTAAMLRAAQHLQRILRGQRSRRYAQTLKKQRQQRLELEYSSSIIIQCTYRTFVARRRLIDLRMIHNRRCAAADVISLAWKRYRMRLGLCAVSVQRVFRGVLARSAYQRLRQRQLENRKQDDELRRMIAEDIASAKYRQYLKDEEARLARYLLGSEPLPIDVRVEVHADVLRAMGNQMEPVEVVMWCCRSGLVQYTEQSGFYLGALLQRVLECISHAPSSNASEDETCIDVAPATVTIADEIPLTALPQQWNQAHSCHVSHRTLEVKCLNENSSFIEVCIGAEPLDMRPYYDRSQRFVPRNTYHIRLVAAEMGTNTNSQGTNRHSCSAEYPAGVECVTTDCSNRRGTKQLFRYDSSASDGAANVADMLRLQFRDAVIEITQSQSIAMDEEAMLIDDHNSIDLTERNRRRSSAGAITAGRNAEEMLQEEALVVEDEVLSNDSCDEAEDEFFKCSSAMGLSRPATARVRVRMFDPEEHQRKVQALRQIYCCRRIQRVYRVHFSVRRSAAVLLKAALKRYRILSTWHGIVISVLLEAHLSARIIQTMFRRVSALEKVRMMRHNYCNNIQTMLLARDEVYEMYAFANSVDDNCVSCAFQICQPSAKAVAANPALRTNEVAAVWMDEILHLPRVTNCVRAQDVIICLQDPAVDADSMGDMKMMETHCSRGIKKCQSCAAPKPIRIVSELCRS